MHVYVYRAVVLNHESGGAVRFKLDLGFRVYADRSLQLTDSPEGLEEGASIHLLVWQEPDGRILARPHDSARDRWLPRLWRYPGTLIRVIDGDTLDARVSIYPGLAIEERFRLSRVNAPEIFGRRKDDPEYLRGVEARDYVTTRFREHDGRMLLHTNRRGKWRRWLAEVFVGDSTTRLNDELLHKGLAVLWFQARPAAPPSARRPYVLSADLRDRIVESADRLGLPPEDLLHRALVRYLE